MSEPKVSIIIPVYNVEKYLDRCMDSLLSQTLSEIEIILVDDESADSSPRLCDEYALKDNRVKVIHKKNAGAGRARNDGLSVARGKYIGFVDSDDYVDRDMYRILWETAEKYNSDLVMSGVWFVDGNMFSREGERISKAYFKSDTHFETAQELKELRLGITGALPDDRDDSKYGLSVWKNLFKRDIITENKLFFESEREMLSEDALFMIDYISCIGRATGISDCFYNYCRNGESISKSYKKDRLQKGLVFLQEAEKRYSKDMESEEYRIYLDRFWQAFCRVICTQEIMHARDKGISFAKLKQRLKEVCTNDRTREVFGSYPLHKLDIKQAIFAFAIKFKIYFAIKLFVELREK